MDKLGVQHNNGISKPPVHHGKGGAKGKGGGNKGIKVVYISSPMKLTASAEEFRAVVQELTGRDSNVADHDIAGVVPSSSSSSYSTSSSGYGSSFWRGASPSTAARALPPAMASTADQQLYAAGGAGPMPPPFQSMYDQTGGAGALLYGQDYYW